MSNPESVNLLPPPYLRREAERMLPAMQAAVERVVRSGRFLFGPELERFERRFAKATSREHGIGVGTGTDAIQLALRALDVGCGDEVITQSHSSPFTAIAIHEVGATPVYVDSDERDFGIDVDAARAAVTTRTKAIVVVHMYGHPARVDEVLAFAQPLGIHVVEDCAQAQGATLFDRPVGSFGIFGCFSFYPTKNLGALGDSGGLVTDDAGLAARARRLRNGGLESHGVHAERGITSRMDEIQAAILTLRLEQLEAANDQRRAHAEAYTLGLTGVRLPELRRECRWAPHQFVIRDGDRDGLRAKLEARGVPTLVHYPLPIHLQRGFETPAAPTGSLPVAERMAAEVLSLPTHPDLLDAERDEIVRAVNALSSSAL